MADYRDKVAGELECKAQRGGGEEGGEGGQKKRDSKGGESASSVPTAG